MCKEYTQRKKTLLPWSCALLRNHRQALYWKIAGCKRGPDRPRMNWRSTITTWLAKDGTCLGWSRRGCSQKTTVALECGSFHPRQSRSKFSYLSFLYYFVVDAFVCGNTGSQMISCKELTCFAYDARLYLPNVDSVWCAVMMQGLLFMPCFYNGAGALLVMNPLTAKSCVVNKFLFPSTSKCASTRYRGFWLLPSVL